MLATAAAAHALTWLVVLLQQRLELGAGAQVGQVLVAAHLGVVLKAAVHGHVQAAQALVNLQGAAGEAAAGKSAGAAGETSKQFSVNLRGLPVQQVKLMRKKPGRGDGGVCCVLCMA
jgi:hypothetical protein